MNREHNTGCEAAGCLVIAFWVAVLVLIATIMGACTTPPPPQPTPEIVYKTLPAPTPLVITLPGETFTVEVTPKSCIEALDINAEIVDMNLKFMEYMGNNGSWTDSDQTRFSNLIDQYLAAAKDCYNSNTGST